MARIQDYGQFLTSAIAIAASATKINDIDFTSSAIDTTNVEQFLVQMEAIRGETGVAGDLDFWWGTSLDGVNYDTGFNTSQYYTITRLTLLDNVPVAAFFKTTNNGVAYTDYTAAVTDANAATQADLDALDTVANGDWCVIGYPIPFRGLKLDLDAAKVNTNAATMSIHYWDGAAWAEATGLSDGTVAAGKTLAQDGEVTWTAPTNWVASTINSKTYYFVRLSMSAALSADVDIEEAWVIGQAQRASEPMTVMGAKSMKLIKIVNNIAKSLTGIQVKYGRLVE